MSNTCACGGDEVENTLSLKGAFGNKYMLLPEHSAYMQWQQTGRCCAMLPEEQQGDSTSCENLCSSVVPTRPSATLDRAISISCHLSMHKHDHHVYHLQACKT